MELDDSNELLKLFEQKNLNCLSEIKKLEEKYENLEKQFKTLKLVNNDSQTSENKNGQKTKGKPFLIRFRTFRTTFRIPEIESLAHLFGDTCFSYDKSQTIDVEREMNDPLQTPFFKVNFQSKKTVSKILERSVGIG